MPAVRQPDLRAALRLVRDLEAADGTAAVRRVTLTDLPQLIRCDTLAWVVLDREVAARPVDRFADGDEHAVRINLPHGAGLVLHRAGRGFSPDEIAVLVLLRPHLLGAVMRATEAERLDATGLTPRERAVLDLVAGGAPNLAVAHRLQMRPRTVEKHLEHAYAKLGVSSRTAAVAALREITH